MDSSTLTIGAFVLGGTQLIKTWGLVEGKWLQLVAVAIGAVATYLSLYQPDLWAQVANIAIALGITGGVSFLDERTGN